MPTALTEHPERPPARRALAALARRAEADCVAALLAEATLPPELLERARERARRWSADLRAARSGAGGIDALMREFSLASVEGVALMCLAEALLRIPDRATALALIRDKLARGNWRGHLGGDRSLFVNAASWGLLVTGTLVATHREGALADALGRLLRRGGEPLVLAGMDLAMRMLGQQFVLGRDIDEALRRGAARERQGYTHSFDMLGEAALCAADVDGYLQSYGGAIRAIGAAAAGRGPVAGPGVSVKLSALHPRYERAQRDRVFAELLPRLAELARSACAAQIGFTIDAEESERLELSLDLIEALARDPALADWEGLGAAVQAYGRRGPAVIDHLATLARDTGRRLAVRLVKGAYWDSEIKRAQVDGQADYPVYTRKVHTDLAYLACARRLLASSDRIHAQFATHNAMTVATVAALAAEAGADRWEFQCLHGMGEGLYDQALPELQARCRIYAPVGSHRTLLAYLVRRLLENGANSSFVHRLVDPAVDLELLLEDPATVVRTRTAGRAHPAIPGPAALFGPARTNSRGLDLDDDATLAQLESSFAACAARPWRAAPLVADGTAWADGPARPLSAPADRRRTVGAVVEATAATVDAALAAAGRATPAWTELGAAERAALLGAAADRLEERRDELIWLAIHEAGKTLANALGEVREAVDFCRYYAARLGDAAGELPGRPLGTVACISPWNFPVAIFAGQVAAALAAGNVVVAKPAEQTPLAAAAVTAAFHAAGVPAGALQLLPGDGAIGARLVADPRVDGVLFTGSTEVAAAIDHALAQRATGLTVPLVAETGGFNAMIVDSSARLEQVVADALASAFDSAGQRCSALRLLCVQDEIADAVVALLHGALAERVIGDPAQLATDIGPVIDEDARRALEAHVERMQAQARVRRLPLPDATRHGSFVAPTVIELADLGALGHEVFGPVLHVLRYPASGLDALVDRLNATGYGLTLALATRIDETIERVVARAQVGNLYVNRNQIGAVVGVQPFGGDRLSGTGPKAGGPLLLPRLRRGADGLPAALAAGVGSAPQPPGAVPAGSVAADDDPTTPAPSSPPAGVAGGRAALAALAAWAHEQRRPALESACEALRPWADPGRPAFTRLLPGPTGERNTWRVVPRGRVLCVGFDEPSLLLALAATVAAGGLALLPASAHGRACAAVPELPAALAAHIEAVGAAEAAAAEVLLCADPPARAALHRSFAARPGPRVRVAEPLRDGRWRLDDLVTERTLTVNTAAAGGNASLMVLAAD